MWLNQNTLSFSLIYFGSCLFCKVHAISTEKLLDRGFGQHISWINFEQGLGEAKKQNQPIMMIIHKSWCGACKALKPKFAASKEIKELSKHFIMVNVEDSEEPKDKKFAPDGGYIPRILFIGPEGDVLTQFYNENGNPDYKFYYPDPQSIVRSMKKVIKDYQSKDKLVIEEL